VRKVRIVLPEGVDPEKVYVRYGLRRPSGTYSSQVARMPAGGASFEIPAPTDRFKALVWAPGCNIKEFDVPVEKADIELQFACDPLKTVTLRGRVKYVDIIGPNDPLSRPLGTDCMLLGGCDHAYPYSQL
jgi:hypothetical protein